MGQSLAAIGGGPSRACGLPRGQPGRRGGAVWCGARKEEGASERGTAVGEHRWANCTVKGRSTCLWSSVLLLLLLLHLGACVRGVVLVLHLGLHRHHPGLLRRLTAVVLHHQSGLKPRPVCYVPTRISTDDHSPAV